MVFIQFLAIFSHFYVLSSAEANLRAEVQLESYHFSLTSLWKSFIFLHLTPFTNFNFHIAQVAILLGPPYGLKNWGFFPSNASRAQNLYVVLIFNAEFNGIKISYSTSSKSVRTDNAIWQFALVPPMTEKWNWKFSFWPFSRISMFYQQLKPI